MMDDDLVCEYDSTWDSESDVDDVETESSTRRAFPDRNKKAKPGFWSNSSSRNLRAAKDMQNYRHSYPNIVEEDCTEDRMPNLKFYLNEIKSAPDDVDIETFHSEWKSDYKRLERVHSYIQWLFPLREPGVNYLATELTKKEIQAFRENEEAKGRLVESYELMLGFYGIQLTDRETGEVRRSENWKERFANLERNMHNNLRITRILKSLGELGFEHFQAPLVRFFLEETLVKKNLSSVKRSVLDYFLFAVSDKRRRRELIGYAFQHFEPKDKFVWCPRKIQKRFKKKAEAKRQDSPSRNKRDSEKREDDETQRSEGSSVDPEPREEGSSVDPEPREEGLSVDPEPREEGLSVDPEPREEGSSVDPLPLNNGNYLNNGEMDISTVDKYNDDKKEDQDRPTENLSSGSNQEIEDDEEPENISASPKESGSEKQVSESPKHSLKSSPCSERAGKLARTEENAGLGISDHRRSSGDTFSVSPPETLTDLDIQEEEKTNSMDTGELMDTETSGGDS